MKKKNRSILPMFFVLLFTTAATALWELSMDGSADSETFILDRTGERWDIGQAESVGFKPGGFQYGIGRHAFTTLDDSHLRSGATSIPGSLRVIGVSEGKDAQAYSVSKLWRHEAANTTLNGKPILVGY